jgi:hypothetical protein
MPNPQNLISLKKGYDPRRNLKGRPRKWISEIKDTGYSLSEINDALQVLISLEPEKLERIRTNPQSTVLEISVAAAILKSIQKGDLTSLETLITRMYGKPKERVEQQINITNHVIKLKFGNTEEDEEEQQIDE